MISKILLTVAVIVAALLFIRSQNRESQRQEQEQEQERERQAQQSEQRRTAMFVAIALVALSLAISSLLYYWHWQDEHRIFIVRVLNSHTGVEEIYEVYHGDIEGRSFRTIDGRLINLSDSERMEVQERAAEE